MSIQFGILFDADGRPRQVLRAPASDDFATFGVPGRIVACDAETASRAKDAYIDSEGNIALRSTAPSPAATADALKQTIEDERARRASDVILYAGRLFDADATARERISGVLSRLLRGDGLPAGWVGWRDAGNAMQWGDAPEFIVQTHLRALAVAIEDREQALLVAGWMHKARIDALAGASDIAGLLAYSVSQGWPA